eukprot:gene19667-38583_t
MAGAPVGVPELVSLDASSNCGGNDEALYVVLPSTHRQSDPLAVGGGSGPWTVGIMAQPVPLDAVNALS